MSDWTVIKAEYIAGGTSYRKLAEKYNVSFTTLTRTAQRENWVGLRQQAEDKATTKIVNVVSKTSAKKAVNIIDVADKLLSKIIEVAEVVSDPDSIKKLTAAIKDIKDIKGIKSEADTREQEARIKKLQLEASMREEDDDKPSGVVLIPSITEELKPPIKEENHG